MDIAWKNSLQEYCQRKRIPLPNYRLRQRCGPAHRSKFQVEVFVDGQWYVGDDQCLTKKAAEQSAAKYALIIITSSPIVTRDRFEHLPEEHRETEESLTAKICSNGGRIDRIFGTDTEGQYRFDITGPFCECQNHSSQQIFWIVDTKNQIYVQKCDNSQCNGHSYSLGFPIIDETTRSGAVPKAGGLQCDRCGERFPARNLYECSHCCGDYHCSRCFDNCDACHDS